MTDSTTPRNKGQGQIATAEKAGDQDVRDGFLPIGLHGRHPVCENTVYSVFFDHIRGQQNSEVAEYLSVIPKSSTEDMVTGVGVLPVRKSRMGLIHVYRHPLGRWSWEVPKGFIEPGETPDQAARRELSEETGFALQPEALQELGTSTPEAGLIKGRVRLYSATLDDHYAPSTVEAELGHGAIAFLEQNEIIRWVASGQIEDACTLSLLFMYFVRYGKIDADFLEGSKTSNP